MKDLISRQAAIDKINERQRKLIYCFGLENDVVKIMDIAKSIVIAVPSAQPERKTGKWIAKDLDNFRKYEVVCSECGSRYIGNYDAYDEPCDFNFCPNCGAKMEEGEDNERV